MCALDRGRGRVRFQERKTKKKKKKETKYGIRKGPTINESTLFGCLAKVKRRRD